MKKQKITTVINFILDESGSMSGIKQSVISGFNEYVHGLKQQKGNFLFTLTKFDSQGLRTPYVLTPIKNVEPLTDETYQPGSMTPLYDAVVNTIEKVLKEEPESSYRAYLVAIMTDGEENSSKEHDEKCLKDLVEKLQAKGNWTFLFMGSNQDSWVVAQKFGIVKGNIMDWQATERGTEGIFMAMANSSANYSSQMQANALRGSAMNTSNFFAGSDQTQIVDLSKKGVK